MDQICWPAGHAPRGADVHEVNTAHSGAPADQVWSWLVRPDRWHTYYGNVRDMKHLSGPWPQIELGSRFSWVTFGFPVTTEVTEFEPFQRLAWTGSGRFGARGHHAWLLEEDSAGTIIRTEETQRGLIVRSMRGRLRPAMQREHQRWVDGLALSASSGTPRPA